MHGRKRFAVALVGSIVAFMISFIVFNICFGFWAEWRYPHNNSMAGLSAFIYGLPVGGFAALLVFIVVFARLKRRHVSENVAGALSYSVGWLSGLILFVLDRTPSVRFHAAQSIVTFGVLNILCVISGAVDQFVFVGALFSSIVITLVLCIVCVIRAGRGSRFMMPIAGRIGQKLAGQSSTSEANRRSLDSD
jgi:uncharacterized membrane protein